MTDRLSVFGDTSDLRRGHRNSEVTFLAILLAVFISACSQKLSFEPVELPPDLTPTPPPGDTTAPNVEAFSVPANVSSLNVLISSFTASDDVAVTGYILGESPTQPSANTGNWTLTPPNTYVFSSAGVKTLYAWAKDAAGNVSSPLSATFTITLDGPTIHLTTPLIITANKTLTDDYLCDQTCFIIKGNGITLDFNGHSATFNNDNQVTVPNDHFESWADSTTPSNWTVLSGSATRTAATYFGSWDLTLSPTASIMSSPFTLKGGKTYMGFAFVQGASADSCTIELKRASDDTILASKVRTGSPFSRGYGDDGGATSDMYYKPSVNTDAYLQFTCSGTANKRLGMLTVKPTMDYGIVSNSYNHATYHPDLPPNSLSGSSNAVIKNGYLIQGPGNGVRVAGIRYTGANWTITNMHINMNGINTYPILCTYCAGTTLTNNVIDSSSISVFNRMHGAHGIMLENPGAGQTYNIAGNDIRNVPQGGIFAYSCFTPSDTTSYTISNNTISQKETVTEGYAILLSGIINATIDSNIITPVQGRGILLDAASGCSGTNEKGTKNVTVSNNQILGLKEFRNPEYAENALEDAGIRIRNWGGAYAKHENLQILNNTITGTTDSTGVHRVYGINVTASAAADSIVIRDNMVTVSATGAGKDANAISLQGVNMTLGGTLDISNNTLTSSHQVIRFGGNDGSDVKGVTIRKNRLIQSGIPSVAPVIYGPGNDWYGSGIATGNTFLDNTCENCSIQNICWFAAQVDFTMKWSLSVTVTNTLGQPLAGATVTALDSQLNPYTTTSDENGVAVLTLPQFTKVGASAVNCSSSTLTTTTFAPYTVTASKSGHTSPVLNFAGTAPGTLATTLTGYSGL